MPEACDCAYARVFLRRELLQAGFAVRAGVRDVEKAQASLEVAGKYGILSEEQLKRVTVVGFDLQQPESIGPAIGGATKVRASVVRCWRFGTLHAWF